MKRALWRDAMVVEGRSRGRAAPVRSTRAGGRVVSARSSESETPSCVRARSFWRCERAEQRVEGVGMAAVHPEEDFNPRLPWLAEAGLFRNRKMKRAIGTPDIVISPTRWRHGR